MKIAQLIELLQEEQKITPHAEVKIESGYGMVGMEITVENDGQVIYIVKP